MEQYIPKSTVVAEIEKRIRACGNCYILDELTSLHRTFNSIEAKVVDLEHLEQEVKDFCYEYDDRKDKWYDMTPHDKNIMVNPTWANFAMSIAKYFFELGMCVNNPITAADRGMAEEIIINLKRVEQDYRINLTSEIEWLRSKIQKGEKVC